MTQIPSTLEIASKAKPKPIHALAAEAGIHADELESYGPYKAKVSLRILDRLAGRSNGKLICVTGMTPTREGDGKTCTSIGLTQALGLLKKKVMLCLREPSLSPMFGYKGGASGGGFAQVLPMEDINLHFTGDIHAVEIAHNLLTAVLENHIHYGNALGVDPKRLFWRRTLDISDRQLREIQVGLSKASRFQRHRTGFDITAASEVMAVLSLSLSIHSLKQKLSNISAALDQKGELVTARDLKAAGAMALLLKDAIKPNLVQTLEGQSVLIHTGPFANVSHGNSSLLSIQMALKLAHYVVTESGFAAELGLEKLFDIVCREGAIKPNLVVVVVSIKALKSHAGEAIGAKNPLDVFKEGFANLERHVHNIHKFGLPAIVALNRFPQDTQEEIRVVLDHLKAQGIECAVSEAVRLGGKGAVELAEKILKRLSETPGHFKMFYDSEAPPEKKIERIATGLYGALGVTWLDQAKEDLSLVHRLKLDHLAVNIAKTPYSFSDDPHVKGAPSGWKLKVRGVRACTGAGFLVALCGKILLMPGLPEKPMLEEMDLSDDGQARGLF